MSDNVAFIVHSGYASASVGSTEGRAGRTTAVGGLGKVRGGVCSSRARWCTLPADAPFFGTARKRWSRVVVLGVSD